MKRVPADTGALPLVRACRGPEVNLRAQEAEEAAKAKLILLLAEQERLQRVQQVMIIINLQSGING